MSRAWSLLARAEDWPAWWTSVATTHLDRPPVRLAQKGPGRLPLAWPTLLGRKLRLRVSLLAQEPMDLLEWRCHGDVEGRWTWMLDSGLPEDVAITCRWELPLAGDGRSLAGSIACWLIERRVFALTAALAQDMGHALQCRTTCLREWHGSVRHAYTSSDR